MRDAVNRRIRVLRRVPRGVVLPYGLRRAYQLPCRVRCSCYCCAPRRVGGLLRVSHNVLAPRWAQVILPRHGGGTPH